MTKKKSMVANLECAGCASTIKNELLTTNGIVK
jgi:copper chaperone CopZ